MPGPDPMIADATVEDERTAEWRGILTIPGVAPMARFFRMLPSSPRCPVCHAPYRAPFGPIVRRLGFGRSSRYPQLCNPCFNGLASHPGGAEVSITVLFADVRGSTALAEQSSAGEFSRLLQDFYALATEAVQAEGGIVDKFLGDGVMCLFLPSFTERHDAANAIAAARRILTRVHLPVGIGVNTGLAFTGFLGPTAEVAGFSAVGDAVNVAHRLGESAGAGELLVSADTATQAALATDGSEGWTMRRLTVKGREAPVDVWSVLIPAEEATLAA